MSAGRVVHFCLGKTVLRGEFVDVIGSGVVVDIIATDGGTRSAMLVDTADGPRVVRRSDLRRVSS